MPPPRDHPREYGENSRQRLCLNAFRGSSPRIRGELSIELTENLFEGIIPANTGRMTSVISHLWMGWDHPREYGENYAANPIRVDYSGSSPRIRGEYGPAARKLITLGIIPANTGRIRILQRLTPFGWDHPREYGENPHLHFEVYPWVGSSPRIRGESAISSFAAQMKGIIPANTGRMIILSARNLSRGDHPREYGENIGEGCGSPSDSGSSPRIRGECVHGIPRRANQGIIPANTGRITES